MDYRDSAIAFASDPKWGEGPKRADLYRELVTYAESLTPVADGVLLNFDSFSEEYEDGVAHYWTYWAGDECNEPPYKVSRLVEQAWVDISGNEEPERAHSIIRIARVELSRALFFSSLLGLSSREELKIGQDEAAWSIIRRTDWIDANKVTESVDSICSTSAATMYYSWIGEVAERIRSMDIEPAPKLHELLSAIALSWLDTAAGSKSCEPALLAEAALALNHAGFESGRQWSKEHGEEPPSAASRLGRMGAAAKHAKSYSAKDQAISLYRAQAWPSKDKAAEIIAPKVHHSFRTVRGWLNNL